jgi:hypothetical protein
VRRGEMIKGGKEVVYTVESGPPLEIDGLDSFGNCTLSRLCNIMILKYVDSNHLLFYTIYFVLKSTPSLSQQKRKLLVPY